MIQINTNEFFEILKVTPAHQNIMIVGKHGIGKSQIIEQYFATKNKNVVTIFLGQMSDPGDLIGLPVLDSKSKKTDFRPPYWFPEEGEPIVLFLDELNRARPEILQSVMDLTLNKKLANKQLPSGSRIIVSANEGDEYQLTDLDPALISRFNVYKFKPTPQEWLLWATEQKLDQRVIRFIDKNRDLLDGDVKEERESFERNPDRRAWQRVSEIIKNVEEFSPTIEKILAGVVGIPAALKFVQFVRFSDRIDAKSIFQNFGHYKKKVNKMKTHELSQLNDALFRILETEEKQDLQNLVQNTEEYIEYLFNNQKNEALAHWTTLYNSDTYPKAKVAILMYSPFIHAHILKFIDKINL